MVLVVPAVSMVLTVPVVPAVLVFLSAYGACGARSAHGLEVLAGRPMSSWVLAQERGVLEAQDAGGVVVQDGAQHVRRYVEAVELGQAPLG